MSKQVVVFLDFDGVTHPEPCFQDNVLCRLPMIEDVLREYPTAGVVISSSWRDVYPFGDLREFFSPDIAPRILGVTPSIKRPSPDWVPGHAPQFEREWECLSWIQQNRPTGTRWLALDDRAHWFSPDCANLLLTDASTGFNDGNQATLRTMLQERV